ncbi:glycosyltransferase [Microvirga terrae]|uniref:Glycosyltransferase n=2 Tax=Microvirga terrae TaxID=2740529 RepID=A0ABY5RYW5_9HYPH|nr:glycosyltransferase family 2 protein [Microvirga terrae]UVF22037.1 glycosyltransferase [Microvirga terrae]
MIALGDFWLWWLQPDHIIELGRYIAITLTLGWLSFCPIYFFAVFYFGRVPNPNIPVPQDYRVAMVVTKAPSEPFEVVRETLEAMLRQTYAHDTWLADEDPQPETVAWCGAHGVRISSRKGRDDYHRSTWPRRTRCKEGNLAYFYDHFGYENYDFVSQLDADHVPDPTYLEEMLRPFIDPGVGYVSAPSICDKNAEHSWSARSRLFIEAPMHGAMQAGYSNRLRPLCIGSHYAVRTAALRSIGGLGPELAEDHSTTLFMAAHGWRGVHAMNATAHGDGPANFADLVTQEFQWSRSLVTILLQYTPQLLRKLPLHLKFQFLFCQLWYPLLSITSLAMFAVPVIALIFDVNLARVTYPDFIAHAVPPALLLTALIIRLARHGLCRPRKTKVLSWEAALYPLVRWPWVLIGTLTAFRDWWTGAAVDFRVTPKGSAATARLPLRVVAPFVILSIGSALPALLLSDIQEARGFYFIALVNSVFYSLVTLTIVFMHAHENRTLHSRVGSGLRHEVSRLLIIAAVVAAPSLAIPLRIPAGARAIIEGGGNLLPSFVVSKLHSNER